MFIMGSTSKGYYGAENRKLSNVLFLLEEWRREGENRRFYVEKPVDTPWFSTGGFAQATI